MSSLINIPHNGSVRGLDRHPNHEEYVKQNKIHIPHSVLGKQFWGIDSLCPVGDPKRKSERYAEAWGLESYRDGVQAYIPNHDHGLRHPKSLSLYESCRKSIILSDVHAPYEDPEAVAIALNIATDFEPDLLVLNGDIDDSYHLSSFDKSPRRLANFQNDLDRVQMFLGKCRQAVPESTFKVYRMGNHEERILRYICRNPELYNTDVSLAEKRYAAHVFDFAIDENDYMLYQGLCITHGSVVRATGSAKGEHEKWGMSGISGHCFDQDTEILTPEGWVTHDKLTEDSVVMTLDRNTGVGEWNKVQQVHRYDNFKELIHLKTTCTDLAMTPEHGLWITSPGRNGIRKPKWNEATASERFGKLTIIPACVEKSDIGLDLTDNQIRFIAWVMAEGNLSSRYKTGTVDNIRISQSDAPDKRLDILLSCIEGCGFEYSLTKRYEANTIEHGTHRNFDAYRINIKNSSDVWNDFLSNYITEDKMPKRALSGMSVHQIENFLDAFVWADGSINSTAPNSRQIASKHKEVIDFLQELCSTSGYRSSICKGETVYYLTLNSRQNITIGADNWSKQSYDGVVWCVTVANGTLLVRRNGKTAVTLNTHRRAKHTKSYLLREDFWIESGCLCRLDPEYVIGKPNWQQGFVLTYLDSDNDLQVEHISIDEGKAVWRGKVYRA